MSDSKKLDGEVKMGRYTLVQLSKEWFDAAKETDEFKGMGQSEMIQRAIEQVRSGEITRESLDKLIAAKKKAIAACETSSKKSESA